MITARITSKGRITIPKSVRESLRLRAGDRVEIEVRGHDEAVLKPAAKSVDEVFGMLHRTNEPARTVEEMNESIARRMRP